MQLLFDGDVMHAAIHQALFGESPGHGGKARVADRLRELGSSCTRQSYSSTTKNGGTIDLIAGWCMLAGLVVHITPTPEIEPGTAQVTFEVPHDRA